MVGYIHLGILNGHAMPYQISFNLVNFYLPCCYEFFRRFVTISPLKQFQGHSIKILCRITFMQELSF